MTDEAEEQQNVKTKYIDENQPENEWAGSDIDSQSKNVQSSALRKLLEAQKKS